jgi:hypothetical protein
MTSLPVCTPALFWLRISRLSCALSKSFCAFAAVGVPGGSGYGNGTRDVSWLTYTSTVPIPRVLIEIPSGIDSKI